MNKFNFRFKRKNSDIFLLSFLFLISILPGIKFLGLLIQVFLFFYYFFRKNMISFAVLLFSYSCYGTSVSVYSFKIIYGLFLLLILFNIKNIISFKFNRRIAFFIIFLFCYEVVYGLLFNYFTQSFSFIVDAFTFFTLIGGYILFSNFTLTNCEAVSIKMYLFWIITSLFCIIFSYGFSTEIDFLGRRALLLQQGESSSIFYFILLFQLFFSNRNVLFRFFLLILYVVINFRLGTFGSMIIMYFAILFGILLLLKFIYLKNKSIILAIIFLVVAVFALFSNVFKETKFGKKSEALTFKMKNITELLSNFSFHDRKKIDLIPLSPYVRILEIINITHSSSPYTLLFGHGWGGYYNDYYYPFENKSIGKILSDADFPLEQRKSHVYTGTHNFGHPYLKYGIMYFFVIALYVLLRLRNIKDKRKKKRIVYYAFVVVLALYSYLGFTFQTALALGLIVSAYRNSTMPNRSKICKKQ